MTSARRGMTLMELMIAIVITGMMATAGAATFGAIVDHRRDILQSTQAAERAAALRETLHSWLAAGTISITTGGLPQMGSSSGTRASSLQTVTPGGSATTSTPSVTAAVAAGDELDFTTVAPNPAGSPQARMRLFVDGDNSTPETGLTVEYQASTNAPLQRRQLEASIGTLVVEFRDTLTGRWYPASEAATITPRAVRITLQPYQGGTLPALLTLPMVFPMRAQQAVTTQ